MFAVFDTLITYGTAHVKAHFSPAETSKWSQHEFCAIARLFSTWVALRRSGQVGILGVPRPAFVLVHPPNVHRARLLYQAHLLGALGYLKSGSPAVR